MRCFLKTTAPRHVGWMKKRKSGGNFEFSRTEWAERYSSFLSCYIKPRTTFLTFWCELSQAALDEIGFCLLNESWISFRLLSDVKTAAWWDSKDSEKPIRTKIQTASNDMALDFCGRFCLLVPVCYTIIKIKSPPTLSPFGYRFCDDIKEPEKKQN